MSPRLHARTAAAACTLLTLVAVSRGAALPTSARETGGAFFKQFYDGLGDKSLFSTSGYWTNGPPFNSGWDPAYWGSENGVLLLRLKKDRFQWQGSDLPYTGGELQSNVEYGVGCYSVCMKAAPPSGTASSFYVQNFGSAGNVLGSKQNEIDIEFIGKSHNMVQTNFFSRTYDPNANSGSGNEQKHELEFSTTDTFASYSFRWRKGRIDWWVNDRLLRTATACEGGPRIPDPEQVSLKIHANIWAVNKQAEEWAGPLDPSFYETAAKYLWIWYEPGENCNIKSDCGTIPQGV